MRLDVKAGRVTVDGQAVKLTSHECRCSSYLMHHKGKVVSRTELTEHLYDQDFDRNSNTIEVFVGRLRKKLPEVIQTVRGLGYRHRRARQMRLPSSLAGRLIAAAIAVERRRARSSPALILTALYRRPSSAPSTSGSSVYLRTLVGVLAARARRGRARPIPGNSASRASSSSFGLVLADPRPTGGPVLLASRSLFADVARHRRRRPTCDQTGDAASPARSPVRTDQSLRVLAARDHAFGEGPALRHPGRRRCRRGRRRDRRVPDAASVLTLAVARRRARHRRDLRPDPLGPAAARAACGGRLPTSAAARQTRVAGDFPAEIAPLAKELNALLQSNPEIIERARTQVGNLAHALKTPLAVLLNEARGAASRSRRRSPSRRR